MLQDPSLQGAASVRVLCGVCCVLCCVVCDGHRLPPAPTVCTNHMYTMVPWYTYGRCDPAGPVRMLVDTLAEDGSLQAGELLLAPSFISAAAEAQVAR
jgi:hypothetical protein